VPHILLCCPQMSWALGGGQQTQQLLASLQSQGFMGWEEEEQALSAVLQRVRTSTRSRASNMWQQQAQPVAVTGHWQMGPWAVGQLGAANCSNQPLHCSSGGADIQWHAQRTVR
jgi:hypothetical protein